MIPSQNRVITRYSDVWADDCPTLSHRAPSGMPLYNAVTSVRRCGVVEYFEVSREFFFPCVWVWECAPTDVLWCSSSRVKGRRVVRRVRSPCLAAAILANQTVCVSVQISLEQRNCHANPRWVFCSREHQQMSKNCSELTGTLLPVSRNTFNRDIKNAFPHKSVPFCFSVPRSYKMCFV